MKGLKPLFLFTFAGLLFSGYLSAVKLFTNTCAFGEGCPLFLGYPACWYGFGMYAVMFAVTLLGLLGTLPRKPVAITDLMVSLLGIIFAGSFVLQEIAETAVTGILGLSTCAYGLIFYAIIFTLSIRMIKTSQVS